MYRVDSFTEGEGTDMYACPEVCVRVLIKTLTGYAHGWVVSVAQLCPTLCDPMNCSLPGPSVSGILQVRILEWVTFPFSRRSS